MLELELKRLISLWADAILKNATEANLLAFVRTLGEKVASDKRLYRKADDAIKRCASQGERPYALDKATRAQSTQRLQVLTPLHRHAVSALNQSKTGSRETSVNSIVSLVVLNSLRMQTGFVAEKPRGRRSPGLATHRTVLNAMTVRDLTTLALREMPKECQVLFDADCRPFAERVDEHSLGMTLRERLALRLKILAAVELTDPETALLSRYL